MLNNAFTPEEHPRRQLYSEGVGSNSPGSRSAPWGRQPANHHYPVGVKQENNSCLNPW
jgi:hypothetical protein